MPCLPGRSCGGFTLLEILVAFVILTMSLAVLFGIFSGGLRSLSLSRQYSLASALAESQITMQDDAQSTGPTVASGATENGMRWERRIEPYSPWQEQKEISAPISALRVSVDVSWKHRGSLKHVNLSVIRLLQHE